MKGVVALLVFRRAIHFGVTQLLSTDLKLVTYYHNQGQFAISEARIARYLKIVWFKYTSGINEGTKIYAIGDDS